MKHLSTLLVSVILLACQSEPQTYTGDFNGLQENAKKMRKWEIVLNGYLSKYEELPNEFGAPVLLYETQNARLKDTGVDGRDLNKSILVSIGETDVSGCFGEYVTLTGKIITHDRGRVFLKATQLNRAVKNPEKPFERKNSKPISCFELPNPQQPQ